MKPRNLILFVLSGVILLDGCSKDENIDLSQWISVYPGAAIVDLSMDRTKRDIVVRNVSAQKMTDLRLEVKCETCRIKVSPERIAELIPGDRASFQLELERIVSKPRNRYPLALTLIGRGLPVAAGLDLFVDSRSAQDKEWIDVGQVTLVYRSNSRNAYLLLGSLPLLVLAGWLLLRWSRARKRAKAK